MSEHFALIGWTGRCRHPGDKEDFTPMDVQRMVYHAIAALALPLVKPKPATIKGQDRLCWQTVAKAVKNRGGKLVAGWSVVDQPPRLRQKNPYARLVLNSHAVWQRDNGEFYETLPERYLDANRRDGWKTIGFIPGQAPTRDACIEFYDDLASLKRLSMPQWDFNFSPFTHVAFPFTV